VKALSLCALAGCASYGTLTTARTVEPGAGQVTAALELDGTGAAESDLRLPMPSLAVGVRRGVARNLDVGGKLSMLPFGDAMTGLGLEGQGRWRFAGAPSRRFELAVAPSAGWRSTATSGARWDAAHAVLPLIIGINLGARRHQLFLSPKIGWQRWWSAGATPIDVPFSGAGIGFAWRLGSATLIPEITAVRSPVEINSQGSTAIVHVGLGLMFDGK
jgi:hypothetical protein